MHASPPPIDLLIWERRERKGGVGCHQFLELAVCDQPFPVEIIQASKFKVQRFTEIVWQPRPPQTPHF